MPVTKQIHEQLEPLAAVIRSVSPLLRMLVESSIKSVLGPITTWSATSRSTTVVIEAETPPEILYNRIESALVPAPLVLITWKPVTAIPVAMTRSVFPVAAATDIEYWRILLIYAVLGIPVMIA